jgi:SAM-dependent methyltransferase
LRDVARARFVHEAADQGAGEEFARVLYGLMAHPANTLGAPRLWDVVADGYAREIAPHFARYGEEALLLAGVGAGSQVIDVACGPGPVALSAARRGARVFAIDFSPEMIACLRDRARTHGLPVDARVGDGMALPFVDASFDAAVCMFALSFFPDRGKAFRELFRVLKPDGRAVVGSWVAMERMPVLAEIYGALGVALPDLPFGRADRPLCAADACRAEMAAAGFREVTVREVTHAIEATSAEGLWRALERSTPPIHAAREQLGEEQWAEVHRRITDELRAKWGTGPRRVPMTANLALGRR